jgi:hypothetical protein
MPMKRLLETPYNFNGMRIELAWQGLELLLEGADFAQVCVNFAEAFKVRIP